MTVPMIVVVMLGASFMQGAPKPPKPPEVRVSAVTSLGLECDDLSRDELAAQYPGLKLTGKNFVVVKKWAVEPTFRGKGGVGDPGSLGAGDLILKFGGKAVDSVEKLEVVLGKMALPVEVRIDYLDVTAGSPPRSKRQSVVLLARTQLAAAPPGALPPGVLPPGGLPPGVLPPGALPPGALPPGALPPGALPPASAPPGTAAPSQVDVAYDKVKDHTVLSLPVLGPVLDAASFMQLGLSGDFKGEQWLERPAIHLLFTYGSDSWQFLAGDRSLYMTLDGGKPIQVQSVAYEHRPSGITPSCIEGVGWEVPADVCQKLKQAKLVECKAGSVEFVLPPTFAGMLTDFERKVDSLAGVAPPSAPQPSVPPAPGAAQP